MILVFGPGNTPLHHLAGRGGVQQKKKHQAALTVDSQVTLQLKGAVL